MLAEADIVAMIMEFAARCGDPTPIHYVRGTRGELNSAIGAGTMGTDAETPAVLVEAVGNFSWPRPVGIVPRRPTGRAVTMIINEITGVAVDAGIDPEPHDLSSLRDVHHPAVPK